MTTSTIQSFPANKVPAARKALEQAFARLARAAARAGQAAPAAPELVVGAERVESRCTECHSSIDGFAGGKCFGCGRGYMVSRKVVDLEVRTERPALAGWEFLAVVEPLEGGNLIRQVPSAVVAEGELLAWRDGDIACDHCRAARRRAETFIVRADGSDPAVPAGTYKQVGRNCLEAFLGGRSAAAILASIAWPNVVAGEAGEGGGWGGAESVYEPAEFLAWVAAVVRIDGWVSKATARDTDRTATASQASYLNTYPFGFEARLRWERDRETYRPTDDDRARAAAAIAWARDLPGTSDYERNLSLVARQSTIAPSHAGIFASAVSAHARFLGEQLKRSQVAAFASEHLGAVGDKKYAFGRVTLERVIAIETDYGTLHIHTFRDERGNSIVWRTGEAHGGPGDTFTLVGTIKGHSEFRGEKQTEATRCKLTKCGS